MNLPAALCAWQTIKWYWIFNGPCLSITIVNPFRFSLSDPFYFLAGCIFQQNFSAISRRVSLMLSQFLYFPDKDPHFIDGPPTCNHALSICSRGKACSQIFNDFKSNCKSRDGKCRMESRWVENVCIITIVYFKFRRSGTVRQRSVFTVPRPGTSASPEVNIYVCLFSRKNFTNRTFPLPFLFIIQVTGSAERSFSVSIKDVNPFCRVLNFLLTLLHVCVVRASVPSPFRLPSNSLGQLAFFNVTRLRQFFRWT